MRVTTLSRILATLSALVLAGACQESFSTGPNNPSLDGLTVEPRSATIEAGRTVTFKATLRDENGDAVSGAPVAWRSSDDAVATVASSGEVFGRSAGRAVITAAVQGKSQFSTVLVMARKPKDDPKPPQP